MTRTSPARNAAPTSDVQPETFESGDLRPIRIWVPNVRSPAFLAAAKQQSLAVAQNPQDAEDQAFIDAISVWESE